MCVSQKSRPLEMLEQSQEVKLTDHLLRARRGALYVVTH